jgi:DNA-binding HxlR family transcriptional regulator
MRKPVIAAMSSARQAINEPMQLLQRRWMLRVLWELRNESLTFRALQSRCDEVSPTVLNQRLAELRAADLLEHDGAGYSLTPIGAELVAAFAPLSKWAVRWKRSMDAKQQPAGVGATRPSAMPRRPATPPRR